jgi:hypothetical protein
MKKEKTKMTTEYAIYDPDGVLHQRGFYSFRNAMKRALELRGRFGEKFKYRPFRVEEI